MNGTFLEAGVVSKFSKTFLSTIWQSSCPKIPLKSELFDIFQTTLQYLSDYTVKIPV